MYVCMYMHEPVHTTMMRYKLMLIRCSNRYTATQHVYSIVYYVAITAALSLIYIRSVAYSLAGMLHSTCVCYVAITAAFAIPVRKRNM